MSLIHHLSNYLNFCDLMEDIIYATFSADRPQQMYRKYPNLLHFCPNKKGKC